MTELNQEALEKAYAAFIDTFEGTRRCLEVAIRTYLASLPPVDAKPVALQGERDKLAKLYETTVRCYTGAISRYEAAEAEVARLKAELAEAHRVIEQAEKVCAFDWSENDEDAVMAIHHLDRAARSFRDGQKTGEMG